MPDIPDKKGAPRWRVQPAAGSAPAPLEPSDDSGVPMETKLVIDHSKDPFSVENTARYEAWKKAHAEWAIQKQGPPPEKPDIGFDLIKVPVKVEGTHEPDPGSAAPVEARAYVDGIVPPAPTLHKTFEMETIKVNAEGAKLTAAPDRGARTMPRLSKLLGDHAPDVPPPEPLAAILDVEADAKSRTVGGRTARLPNATAREVVDAEEGELEALPQRPKEEADIPLSPTASDRGDEEIVLPPPARRGARMRLGIALAVAATLLLVATLRPRARSRSGAEAPASSPSAPPAPPLPSATIASPGKAAPATSSITAPTASIVAPPPSTSIRRATSVPPAASGAPPEPQVLSPPPTAKPSAAPRATSDRIND